MKKLDLTGKRFGRLTVIEEAGKNCGHITWRCRCDCGNEIIAKGIHLKSGHTTSCGCKQKEVTASIRFEDLTGKKYGKLTVLQNLGKNNNGTYEWLCQCECGNLTVVPSHSLKGGLTHSCGCLVGEKCGARNLKHGYAKRGKRDITFSSWCSMWARCSNPRYKGYYGKVTICDRWRDFSAFVEDMGLRPSVEMSIDRIDSKGNYEPSNCRWATDFEQANNTSRNHKEYFDGEYLSLAEISRRCGIGQTTLGRRLKSGLTIKEATTFPLYYNR